MDFLTELIKFMQFTKQAVRPLKVSKICIVLSKYEIKY